MYIFRLKYEQKFKNQGESIFNSIQENKITNDPLAINNANLHFDSEINSQDNTKVC